MNLRSIRIISLSAFVFICTHLSAQKPVEDEYKAEIGLTGGVNYYIGETNSQLFNNSRLAYSGFFRYKIDNRLALKAELTSATVAGVGSIDNNVYAGDICGEFNFFHI